MRSSSSASADRRARGGGGGPRTILQPQHPFRRQSLSIVVTTKVNQVPSAPSPSSRALRASAVEGLNRPWPIENDLVCPPSDSPAPSDGEVPEYSTCCLSSGTLHLVDPRDQMPVA